MKEFWGKWKRLAEKIGTFQIKIIFSLFYIIFVIPLGLLTKKNDYFKKKTFPSWDDVVDNSATLKKLKEQ